MIIDIIPIQVPLAAGIITVSSLQLRSVSDAQSAKFIYATFINGACLRLWEGNAYDAIGNWTDADVVARIQTLATDVDTVRGIIT